MTSSSSGPVSGPPVGGSWQRTDLELTVDPDARGLWTGLRAGSRTWVDAGRPGREVFAGAGEGHGQASERGWQPAAERMDRLGQPTGSAGWRVVTDDGTLTRTVHPLSGAVRVGYRVSALEPWRHEVQLGLVTSGSAETVHGEDGRLVAGSGWAHAWVLDGDDALGLHWTTEERSDLPLLGLRTGEEDGRRLLAPAVGSVEQPAPPRRDFSWRLVLTGWRR
ncbi:hypothetical protein GC722_15465 [Auraticoccus sp. F435]|uniref:Uncharacterized protein n=1 Tax=Auraticoccus cholistanensis TaxID=2656650 RepID=A0A6A9UXC0_9ACTN|nr:hypothetical protein [Auraticoccus cholistanensis]MVA77408.1 hypothetical protein [Auraticoccus cholistanensis]